MDDPIACPACGSDNVICEADDETLAAYTDCLDCGRSFINTDCCDPNDAERLLAAYLQDEADYNDQLQNNSFPD